MTGALEEGQVQAGTDPLEFTHELGPAVDLDGFDFEGCFFDDIEKESLCRGTGDI